jgi:hypothetical protein
LNLAGPTRSEILATFPDRFAADAPCLFQQEKHEITRR